MKVSKQTIKRRKLIALGEKLWGKLVFKKWGKFCELSGKPASLPHHFFNKGNCARLRFEVDNGVPLAYGIHYRLHQTGDPLLIDQIIGQRGREWFEALVKKSQEQGKFNTIFFIKSEIERLQELTNNYDI